MIQGLSSGEQIVYTHTIEFHIQCWGEGLLSATAGGSLAENAECSNSDIKGRHCMLPLICEFESRRCKFALLEMRGVVIFGEKVECNNCQKAGSGFWIMSKLPFSPSSSPLLPEGRGLLM